MTTITTSITILAFLFGGALAGTWLRDRLPQHHVGEESKNVVLLGAGLVVTMSALVLGLLVSSAQDSFGAQRAEVTQLASKIVWLDRVLASYGPEARPAREKLRGVAEHALETLWSSDGARPSGAATELFAEILALAPADDGRRAVQSLAIGVVNDLGQTRWLMYEQRQGRLPVSLLVGLVAWLTAVFVAFGLFAPRNSTVVASLFVAALSVTAAIFLILEMYSPYTGFVQVSREPLRAALLQLGR